MQKKMQVQLKVPERDDFGVCIAVPGRVIARLMKIEQDELEKAVADEFPDVQIKLTWGPKKEVLETWSLTKQEEDRILRFIDDLREENWRSWIERASVEEGWITAEVILPEAKGGCNLVGLVKYLHSRFPFLEGVDVSARGKAWKVFVYGVEGAEKKRIASEIRRAVEQWLEVEDRLIKQEQALLEAIREVGGWWSSWPDEFRDLVMAILGSLPGGEDLEELVKPVGMGWKEAEILGKLLVALRDSGDVARVVNCILSDTWPE